MKYNRDAYKRYEFNVRVDSLLNGIIERYKQNPDNNLSELIRVCLCQYFGLNRHEADSIFVEFHFGMNGTHIINNQLDKYFP
jgi:hypothetical protein